MVSLVFRVNVETMTCIQGSTTDCTEADVQDRLDVATALLAENNIDCYNLADYFKVLELMYTSEGLVLIYICKCTNTANLIDAIIKFNKG